VGTGMHPDLTGRENIYLNGAILGLTRIEINERFDEIVDFSDVEKFIDTPIKRYSSGMKIRLGFSVAAHLDPDILIVDEVLAVGDEEFKRKAITKMQDGSKDIDRTVLFVSHDLASIRRLCTKCMLIENGEIVLIDNPEVTINYYLKNTSLTVSSKWINERSGNDKQFVYLQSAEVIDAQLVNKGSFYVSEKIGIRFNFIINKETKIIIPAINLSDGLGNLIFNAVDVQNNWQIPKEPGKYSGIAWIPGNLLGEKDFFISIALVFPTHGRITQKYFNEQHILSFSIIDLIEKDSAKGILINSDWTKTLISPKLDWDHTFKINS